MKIRMAERSLFAILLRAPWWVSLLLVVAIALVSGALLPAAYVLVGVLSAFPFLVIGLIAAWRQWRAPSPAALAQTLTEVQAMPWRVFAETVAQACQARECQVERLNHAGADFRLTQAGKTTLLSARRWKAAQPGVEALRELAQGIQDLDAQSGVFLSLAPVSEPALRLARERQITVICGADLARWLRQPD